MVLSEMSDRAYTNDLPAVEEILADPAVSFWLTTAPRSALPRDPVDTANNADLLARLLELRCRNILKYSTRV